MSAYQTGGSWRSVGLAACLLRLLARRLRICEQFADAEQLSRETRYLVRQRHLAETNDARRQPFQFLLADLQRVRHRQQEWLLDMAFQPCEVLLGTRLSPEAQHFQAQHFRARPVPQAKIGHPETVAERENVALLDDLP